MPGDRACFKEATMTKSHSGKRFLMIVVSFLIFGPIFAAAQVSWVKSFDAALKQAAKEKKFIVLDISASW